MTHHIMIARPQFVLALTLLFAPTASSAGTWSSHSPHGGRVNALAVDPAMPSTLYADLVGPIEVQLKQASDGVCWSAVFPTPFKKRDAATFFDTSD